MNFVGQELSGSTLARGIMRVHDLHLDSEYALLEQHVTHSGLDVVVRGVAGVDHESLDELHALGSLSTKLSRHNDFASHGLGLHDASEHGVACTTHSKTSDELVTERLALGDGAESTSGHLLGEQIYGSLLQTTQQPSDSATHRKILGDVYDKIEYGGSLES